MYADYSQYEAELAAPKANKGKAKAQAATVPASVPVNVPKTDGPKKKLGYTEQREYDQLEGKIQAAEASLATARAAAEAPDVVTDHVRLQAAYAEIERHEREVETLYARWAELEAKLAG